LILGGNDTQAVFFNQYIIEDNNTKPFKKEVIMKSITLRRILLIQTILLVLFLWQQKSFADTDIPEGEVSGTWTLANSPYHINGEITIPNGETMTIEPGVEVVFSGNYKFNVQGRILAIGTESDTIVFTINDTTGFHNLTIPDGGWGGIRFINTPSNNDSSKIIYCKLQYGKANTGEGNYDRWGGALCAKINKLLVSHCLFRNNTCYKTNINETGGGAIAIVGNPVIEFCEFSENTSSFGGAMLIWGSDLYPLIRNNYFHHNQGHGSINIGSWGGSNTSPVLINNIIANNNSNGLIDANGHGIVHISNGGGNTVFINNTIVNNSCTGSGGAVFINYKAATSLLINNIIYGNEPSQVNLLTPSSLSFLNCLVEGGKEGFTGAAFTGTYQYNIDRDPMFVNAANNDFHLMDSSPCISQGADSVEVNGTWYYTPSSDIESNPRPNPYGTAPDIGACESDSGHVFIPVPSAIERLVLSPSEFQLYQNYPNPFNPTTSITYTLSRKAQVKLTVYDLLGREVAVLVNEAKPAGAHQVKFNAAKLSSGVYLYRIQTGEGFMQTRKLMILK
jgi:hypothetical protein